MVQTWKHSGRVRPCYARCGLRAVLRGLSGQCGMSALQLGKSSIAMRCGMSFGQQTADGLNSGIHRCAWLCLCVYSMAGCCYEPNQGGRYRPGMGRTFQPL